MINYKIELSEKSVKVLDKMKNKDKHNWELIINHLRNLEQKPEILGKPLVGNLNGLWSYRAGDFRIIFRIQTDKIFVITIGHRREVYD